MSLRPHVHSYTPNIEKKSVGYFWFYSEYTVKITYWRTEERKTDEEHIVAHHLHFFVENYSVPHVVLIVLTSIDKYRI